MAVSLVQKTAQGYHSTGVTSIPAFAASGAGTTLVAVLESSTAATAFTQTTGSGWTHRASAVGSVCRAELWTYENNPGGITTAQWTSGTGQVNGEISEWTGSGTVTLDGTPGTGTAGAAAALLALVNGSANQAGDAGIAVFADMFSATQAGSTWTSPAGWTVLAQLVATSATLAFVGYYKTGVAAGTLAVTGTYSTSTGSTGWAGIVATFKDTVASLTVTTGSLGGGTVASPYSASLAATGGTGTGYAWSVSAGSLPAGLSLSAGGTISGTPSVAGTSSFTVKVTDSGGNIATQALSIVVAASAGRAAQLIGFDVAPGTWPAANAAIGPGQAHRMFYSGSLPAAFDGDGTPSSVTCIVSYKTVNTNVAAYIASIPGARQVILIYHHEPEGDYANGSTFVAEFQSQSTLIRAQGAPNVRVAMAAGDYQYAFGTADSMAGNYLRGLGPYVDMFTIDTYQGSASYDWPSGGLANWAAFQAWLTLVTSPSIVGTLKPLGITEYGIYDGWPGYTPAGRTARIQLDHDYLAGAFLSAIPAACRPVTCWCYWWWNNTAGAQYQPQFTDGTTEALWSGFETEGAATLAITTGSIPAGQQGAAYAGATILAAGGQAPYVFTLQTGAWPVGISMTTGGVISGTPTVNGSFPVTVLVTDAAGSTDTQVLTLTVAPPPATVTVTTTSLPGGMAGTAYTAPPLTATGGTTPYTWGLQGGSVLPSGMTLTSGGLLGGTPDTAGNYSFTVQVTDSLAATGTQLLALAIAPAPGPVVPPAPVIISPLASWSWTTGPRQPAGGQLLALTEARSRTVTFRTAPGTYHEASFSIDGTHPQAASIFELTTDLQVTRNGQLLAALRIVPTDDELDASQHVLTVTALDYREVLRRRFLLNQGLPGQAGGSLEVDVLAWEQTDPALIAWQMIQATQLHPGGDLGIVAGLGQSTGLVVDYTATQGDFISDDIDALAQQGTGFEWDISAYGTADLRLDIWSPQRGNARGVVLEYGGGLVQSVSRQVDPTTFGNAGLVTGDSTVAGLVAALVEAPHIATDPAGRWDFILGTQLRTAAALAASAFWAVAAAQVVIPSYSIVLQPGAWGGPGHIWIGDSVTVRIKSGRLAVNDLLRVMELAVAISDEGDETVTLQIGRIRLDPRKLLPLMLRRLKFLESL